MWLAPLRWDASRCEQQEAAQHRLEVRVHPSSGLSSFRLTEPERELLGVSFDVPGPFLMTSDSPQPIKPGNPGAIERDPDGSRIVLRDMPMGELPVRLDWAICSTDDGFEQRFRWHVLSDLSIAQAGWSLSVSFAAFAGAQSSVVPSAGFGHTNFASDDSTALAVAYRDKSAFGEDSRAFGVGFVAYRSIAALTAQTWTAGDYEGGVYRVAAVSGSDGESLADATYTSLMASDEPCPL